MFIQKTLYLFTFTSIQNDIQKIFYDILYYILIDIYLKYSEPDFYSISIVIYRLTIEKINLIIFKIK